MAQKDLVERFGAKPSDIAQELLEPLLSFLQQAGISQTEASKAFRSAWNKSKKKKASPISLESLKDPQPYVDLVATWSRNSVYLNKAGLPRDLPLRGLNGFASMVRKVAPKLEPKKALLLLHAYGNVERLTDGKVRLIKPFFHIKSESRLAFEPSVRFLLDAARNVKASLRDAAPHKGVAFQTQSFWRTVDSKNVPQVRRKAYLAFVKELSLTFLQDIDDWLSENSQHKASNSKTGRIGLGLFTIGTAPE